LARLASQYDFQRMQIGPAIYGDVVHRFAPEPASVPEARQLTREFAEDLMQGEQASKLDMAVTEVFSNAVRHSGSEDEILLALTQKDDYLCVRVSDGGTGLVPGALTRRWGMTREDGRTRVWFELDYAE
jgi:anti-sigma regulatory factor (Ser/Thr protein kinase)